MLILEWFAFCYQKKTTAYNLIEDINHKMLHNKFKNSFVNTSKFIYTFRIKIKLLSWYMQKNALLARVLGHYTIVHEGVHGIGTWNILNTSIPYHLQLSFAGCFFILRATDGAVSSPSSPNNMSGGSASAVNGVIVSPNFPGQYPRNTQCTYWLVGRPQQSVRLIFSSFFVDGYTPYAFGFLMNLSKVTLIIYELTTVVQYIHMQMWIRIWERLCWTPRILPGGFYEYWRQNNSSFISERLVLKCLPIYSHRLTRLSSDFD